MIIGTLSSLSLVLAGQAGQVDHLAVVRCDATHASQKAGLFAYGAGIASPAVTAFDPTFFQFGGSQPIRHVFSMDIQGNGTDEIGVVREQLNKGGRYVLSFHSVPATPYASVSTPCEAKKLASLGSAKTAGTIVAIDGVDVNGDFRDEIVIVRTTESGEQRIEIYAPPGMSGLLAAPFTSYAAAGSVGSSEIVDAVGCDYDGNSIEEIALHRRSLAGDTIEIVPAPSIVADHLGSPLLTFPIDQESESRLLVTTLDDDESDDLLLWSPILDGTSAITPLWTSKGGVKSASAPLKSFATNDAFPIAAPLMIRGATTKAPFGSPAISTSLNSELEFGFCHVVPSNGYYGGSNTTEVGPIVAKSQFDATTGILTMQFANAAAPIVGKLEPGFTKVALSKNVIEFPLTTGGKLHVVLQSLTVVKLGGTIAIQGTYSSGSWVGFGTPLSNGVMTLSS